MTLTPLERVQKAVSEAKQFPDPTIDYNFELPDNKDITPTSFYGVKANFNKNVTNDMKYQVKYKFN